MNSSPITHTQSHSSTKKILFSSLTLIFLKRKRIALRCTSTHSPTLIPKKEKKKEHYAVISKIEKKGAWGSSSTVSWEEKESGNIDYYLNLNW
jgi:hypothetical protein